MPRASAGLDEEEHSPAGEPGRLACAPGPFPGKAGPASETPETLCRSALDCHPN